MTAVAACRLFIVVTTLKRMIIHPCALFSILFSFLLHWFSLEARLSHVSDAADVQPTIAQQERSSICARRHSVVICGCTTCVRLHVSE